MIKQLLNKIFCLHDWKFEDETVWGHDHPRNGAFQIHYFKRLYICTKCGAMKQIRQ